MVAAGGDELFSIEVTGDDEVIRALEQWERESIETLTKAVDASLEDLLTKAQGLAPKLTGDLESSGAKTAAKANAATHEISGEVGFHKVYAARRHEETYNPGPITRGKPPVDGFLPGPKYLERPLWFNMNRYFVSWAQKLREIKR